MQFLVLLPHVVVGPIPVEAAREAGARELVHVVAEFVLAEPRPRQRRRFGQHVEVAVALGREFPAVEVTFAPLSAWKILDRNSRGWSPSSRSGRVLLEVVQVTKCCDDMYRKPSVGRTATVAFAARSTASGRGRVPAPSSAGPTPVARRSRGPRTPPARCRARRAGRPCRRRCAGGRTREDRRARRCVRNRACRGDHPVAGRGQRRQLVPPAYQSPGSRGTARSGRPRPARRCACRGPRRVPSGA